MRNLFAAAAVFLTCSALAAGLHPSNIHYSEPALYHGAPPSTFGPPHAGDDEGRKPGNTVVVAKSGGDFATVQEAVDSITDDGMWTVIQIHPGTYEENITCDKNNVCFRGIARRAVTIRHDSVTEIGVWTDGDYPLQITGDNCRVENLTLVNNRPQWAACSLMVGSNTVRVPSFTTADCDFISVAKDTVWFWNTGNVQMLNCYVKGYNHVVSIIADQCLLANVVLEPTYGSGTALWAYASIPTTTIRLYNVVQLGAYACLDLGCEDWASYTVQVDGYTALSTQGWFLNLPDDSISYGRLYYGRVSAATPVVGIGAADCAVYPINQPYAENATFRGTVSANVLTGDHFRLPTRAPANPEPGDVFLQGSTIYIYTMFGWKMKSLE